MHKMNMLHIRNTGREANGGATKRHQLPMRKSLHNAPALPVRWLPTQHKPLVVCDVCVCECVFLDRCVGQQGSEPMHTHTPDANGRTANRFPKLL